MNHNQENFSSNSKDEYELLEETKKLRNAKSTLYIPKKERYEDASSSAFIFVLFGIIGDAIAILSAFDVIHLPIAANRMSQISMLLLFTIFLCIGVYTALQAKRYKKEIVSEADETKEINTWLSTNITADTLASVVDENEADEINYLAKLSFISEQLQSAFPKENTDFLEALADEFLNQIEE